MIAFGAQDLSISPPFMRSPLILFDPSIASTNLGDEVIAQAVRAELHDIVPDANLIHLPTQMGLDRHGHRIRRLGGLAIVGGTNLLSSNLHRYRQWKINLPLLAAPGHIVLMGVGWWQYQRPPGRLTAAIYKRLLSPSLLHAARDSHTVAMLNAMDFTNVVNTGCPTLWRLTPVHCANIPSKAADEVLLTLTDYARDPESDLALLELLLKQYRRVYFWPQGHQDLDYFRSLPPDVTESIILLDPRLAALDKVLRPGQIDFIGTRLHAGIRALQQGVRTLIIAVDNRATEMGRDFHLPVVSRTELNQIPDWIYGNHPTELKLPWSAIREWRTAFATASAALG